MHTWLISLIGGQMKSWSSDVYDHFKPPTISAENGEVIYNFVCKKQVLFYDYQSYLLTIKLLADHRLSKSREFDMTTVPVTWCDMPRHAMAGCP